MSYQQLHDDPDAAIADIVDRYHDVADRCDAVVIVGSDYTDVTTPSELDTNARIAANLGAPVVLAVKAKDRTPTEVAQVVELCLIEISGQHAHTAAVVANRCDPAQMAAVADALQGLRAEVVCHTRRTASGRARGRRSSARRRRHAGQRRSGAAQARSDGCARRGHDRRARAGATHRRRRGHHARRPLRRRARGRQCSCRGRLSVAVVHHPQRRPRAASVDRQAGGRAEPAPADHRDHVRHVRDGEQGRRDPRPRHGVLASQDRHRDRVDGHPRRHRGSACAAGHPDPNGRHAADVHLPAAGPGAGRSPGASCCPRARTTASSRRRAG